MIFSRNSYDDKNEHTCAKQFLADKFQLVRAACLQNEIAPEKLLNRYEKRFEKREICGEKGSEKLSETHLKKKIRPSQAAYKYFTGTFQLILKSFSPPKICTKKSFFSARLCRGGGHANNSIKIHLHQEIIGKNSKWIYSTSAQGPTQ